MAQLHHNIVLWEQMSPSHAISSNSKEEAEMLYQNPGNFLGVSWAHTTRWKGTHQEVQAGYMATIGRKTLLPVETNVQALLYP